MEIQYQHLVSVVLVLKGPEWLPRLVSSPSSALKGKQVNSMKAAWRMCLCWAFGLHQSSVAEDRWRGDVVERKPH